MKTEEQRLLDDLYNRDKRAGVTYPDTSIKFSTKTTTYPDAKKHQIVSFVKSGVRILACIVGSIGYYEFGFFGLAAAEVVGIIEELV